VGIDALGLWSYQDPRLKGKGVPEVLGGVRNNQMKCINDCFV